MLAAIHIDGYEQRRSAKCACVASVFQRLEDATLAAHRRTTEYSKDFKLENEKIVVIVVANNRGRKSLLAGWRECGSKMLIY